MEQVFETIQELQARVEENPQDAGALLELAGMYLEISRLDEARAYLDRLLELEPGHREGLTQLGLVLAESGDLDGARARFQAAVEGDPDYWEGWFYLAVTEIRRGDMDAAGAAADRVEALHPGLPELADLRNHLAEHRSREER
jgi:tetratricopeptide (TPR) repeat protein